MGGPLQLIALVADCQDITGPEAALGDALIIDADAVGAAEIADDKIVFDLGQATVSPRYLPRAELNIAFLMATQEHDGLVEQDVGAIGQCHEFRRHGEYPPAGATPSRISTLHPSRASLSLQVPSRELLESNIHSACLYRFKRNVVLAQVFLLTSDF
jgi:hypothetical protein